MELFKKRKNWNFVFIFFSSVLLLFGNNFFTKAALAAQCCPAAGNCTIIISPCDIGGSFTGRNIGLNVNTSSPVKIVLTSDLDLTGSDIDFENKYAGASKEVKIDGTATGSTSARNVSMTGGNIIYPSGGLTIDLSVPAGLTGDGGNLDAVGAGGTSSFIIPNSNLKIYTWGGSGGTGGYVDITFSSNTLLSGTSAIKTGNTSVANVNGGLVDLTGSGDVGTANSAFISTSSSRKAGNVNITGSGSLRGGIRANSCENFAGCGQVGGTIDLTGLGKYYSANCTEPSLEAKDGGLIKATTSGSFDLSRYVNTGGGTLDFTGPNLSNCSCCSQTLDVGAGSNCTGGAVGTCRYELGLNNTTVDFTGVDCNPSSFLSPNCSSTNNSPNLLFVQPDGVGDIISVGGSYSITYSLNDSDNVVTSAFYYDNNNSGYDGTAIASCSAVPESAGAVCAWNTTGVPAGSYYIYGKTSDGVNPEVKAYSSGAITIGTAFDYDIADMTDVILAAGAAATKNISLNLIQSPSQNVSLSYSVSPSEPLIGLSWPGGSVCQPNCSRLLDINISPSVSAGDYVIKITGQSQGLPDKEKTFKITVIPAVEYSNLYDFGWSDTIGWLSFSSKDCDTDGDGTFEGGAEDVLPVPANCPISGQAFPYGARINLSTNYLSGYAWGENLGWVSFNWPDIGDGGNDCPGGAGVACQPRFNSGNNQFYGWARACSVFQNNCTGLLRPAEQRGGWDGWISLNCSNDSTCATSDYKVGLTGSALNGWAWAGLVGGWISFDGVRIRLGDNKPVLAIFNQPGINYCKKDLPGAISLRWEFNDLEDGYGMQTAYEVELTRSDGATCAPGKKGTAAIPDRTTNLLGTEINSASMCGANFIAYGGYTYTWKLRVFDSNNNVNEGGFMLGNPFPDNINEPGNLNPTPSHRYPVAKFTYTPTSNILQFMPITFDPSQSWSDDPPFVIDRYQWFFDYVSNPTVPDAESGTPPPAGYTESHAYSAANNYVVDLKVRDSGGVECWAHDRNNQKTVNVMSNKPKWNEAVP